ncbi:AAA family ATPase (plasmid) [Sinorhizobium meliloti]|uniref:AAA family ATPase n=1 Tax=Rhizobium meliloti TaxID=382 RepID=UPI00299ED07C
MFASGLGLPLYIVKLDRLISSYLGETATNVRKLFEFARTQPCVLFFDENLVRALLAGSASASKAWSMVCAR